MPWPLMAEVYRWTGYFPERTRLLVRALARRAEALGHVYPPGREGEAAVALSAFLTALAMKAVTGDSGIADFRLRIAD